MTAPPGIAEARATLQQHFGYPAFRPGQESAITSVLAGKDTLVVLPTGGGKSLCYQVPALILPKLTLVISPLISLMKDQVDALTARGLPAAFINSTLSSSQISDRLARAQRGELKLLYVAPERFDVGTTADRLRDSGVSLLAIDEAHCISEWGHDFRPSYLRLADLRERLGWPPTVALTATATPHVRTDIVRQLRLASPETIITGFDRTNLRYHVVATKTDRDKDTALVRLFRERQGLSIVYAATRRSVERITTVLEEARISAMAYHAGLDDVHRHDVQTAFMNETIRVIVATNAFGMGIDKANVRLVVHHAMPGSLEAYYQEAGRAGRDGDPSDCFLLHAFPDRFTHEYFINGAYPPRRLVEAVYATLQRAADRSGTCNADPAAISSRLSIKSSPRDVESALRVLAAVGAYLPNEGSGSLAYVRLLATPERIKRELGQDETIELGLLRTLWRSAGAGLQDGVTIDLASLPPGFGGASGAGRLLDALRGRQFVDWRPIDQGTRLANPKRPLSAFPIDWEVMDRRRAADLAKLDAVQRYAYLKQCRRGYVLRYFGDPAARTSCSGCDNCLGIHLDLSENASPASRTRKPRGEKAVHSAGRGATPPGRGGATPSSRRGATPSSGREAPSPPPAIVSELRALRSRIAKEDGVPAYVVFSDRTLDAMAAARPTTSEAFLTIHGVGPAKLERYGPRFLGVLSATRAAASSVAASESDGAS